MAPFAPHPVERGARVEAAGKRDADFLADGKALKNGRHWGLMISNYSQRNTLADTAVNARNIRVNTATSPRWPDQPSPCQIPLRSDTAYVSGSARATACSIGGSDVDRHEQPGEAEHRIEDQRADRLREARRRNDAGDQKSHETGCSRVLKSSASVNDTSGTSASTG